MITIDVSSNVWLDSSLHQVLQEHSYASLPLPKKRKVSAAASTGPASNNCSTVTNLFDHAATINHSILSMLINLFLFHSLCLLACSFSILLLLLLYIIIIIFL